MRPTPSHQSLHNANHHHHQKRLLLNEVFCAPPSLIFWLTFRCRCDHRVEGTLGKVEHRRVHLCQSGQRPRGVVLVPSSTAGKSRAPADETKAGKKRRRRLNG